MASPCTRNLTVIARNATDGFYYSGFITCNITEDEEKHHVVFHYIRPQDVPIGDVINVGGALPWPELKPWDYVLVKVRCKSNGVECYVPGRVRYLPVDLLYEKRLYKVQLYTHNWTKKMRKYIVKIGKEKYQQILEYISNIRHHPLRFASEPCLTRRRFLDRRQTSVQHLNSFQRQNLWPRSFSSSRTSSACSRRSHSSCGDRSRRSSSEKSSSTLSNKPRIPKDDKLSVKPGEEVLARWKDDGWYYFGKVVAIENGFVRVLDSTGYEEQIGLEDILISNEIDNIEQYEKVIALHPRYKYSYAPATVLNVHKFEYRVQFYDDTERRLPGSEVYRISLRKFKAAVDYIKQQERKLCGRVVARDDSSGFYKPYIAEGPSYQTQQVFLQLPNNIFQKQSSVHVFSLETHSQIRPDSKWKYVIGPLDPACTIYIPAKIINRQPFRLMFCNGMRNDQASLNQCFYVSEDYYKNAVNYFSNCSH